MSFLASVSATGYESGVGKGDSLKIAGSRSESIVSDETRLAKSLALPEGESFDLGYGQEDDAASAAEATGEFGGPRAGKVASVVVVVALMSGGLSMEILLRRREERKKEEAQDRQESV